MKCKQCDHVNPEDNWFCGRCGTRLVEMAQTGTEAGARPPVRAAFTAEGLRQFVAGPTFTFKPRWEASRAAGAPEPADIEVMKAREEPALAKSNGPEGESNVPISGPSFLGLADAAGESNNLTYLYEDGPPRRYGRVIVALLVLAGFAGFIAYQWKQFPSWYTTIVKPPLPPVAEAPKAPVEPTVTPAPLPPASSSTSEAASATDTGKDGPTAAANDELAAKPADSEPAAEGPAGGEDGEVTESADAEPSTSKPAVVTRSEETARQSQSQAMLAKGQAYLYGKGVPKSCSQALLYLRNAADMENPKAYSQLGAMYATGHCVPLDRAQAYEWFTRAKDAGERNVWVERNRRMLWGQMTAAEQQRALRDHLY
ncbi:MAG: hypothetical protein ACE14L_10250 [Terriglobales bacterium]